MRIVYNIVFVCKTLRQRKMYAMSQSDRFEFIPRTVCVHLALKHVDQNVPVSIVVLLLKSANNVNVFAMDDQYYVITNHLGVSTDAA